MGEKTKRYQECGKLEKIWRMRWKLFVPFDYLFLRIKGIKVFQDKEENGKIVHTDEYFMASKALIWRIAQSNADRRMNHFYTSEEVFARLKEKIKGK